MSKRLEFSGSGVAFTLVELAKSKVSDEVTTKESSVPSAISMKKLSPIIPQSMMVIELAAPITKLVELQIIAALSPLTSMIQLPVKSAIRGA